ncbi:MAG: hypothetical protein NT131_07345 [Methanomassiliicoccales archaeon]|nr:hypothetical protein [Methanomassiliicoccales archaeon]
MDVRSHPREDVRRHPAGAAPGQSEGRGREGELPPIYQGARSFVNDHMDTEVFW